MSNYFEEARCISYSKYGSYCNKMQSKGKIPLSYNNWKKK